MPLKSSCHSISDVLVETYELQQHIARAYQESRLGSFEPKGRQFRRQHSQYLLRISTSLLLLWRTRSREGPHLAVVQRIHRMLELGRAAYLKAAGRERPLLAESGHRAIADALTQVKREDNIALVLAPVEA